MKEGRKQGGELIKKGENASDSSTLLHFHFLPFFFFFCGDPFVTPQTRAVSLAVSWCRRVAGQTTSVFSSEPPLTRFSSSASRLFFRASPLSMASTSAPYVCVGFPATCVGARAVNGTVHALASLPLPTPFPSLFAGCALRPNLARHLFQLRLSPPMRIAAPITPTTTHNTGGQRRAAPRFRVFTRM